MSENEKPPRDPTAKCPDCGGDKTVVCSHEPLTGMTFVCEIPEELGRVTALKGKNGKVVAETESGVQFIVPVPTAKTPEA